MSPLVDKVQLGLMKSCAIPPIPTGTLVDFVHPHGHRGLMPLVVEERRSPGSVASRSMRYRSACMRFAIVGAIRVDSNDLAIGA